MQIVQLTETQDISLRTFLSDPGFFTQGRVSKCLVGLKFYLSKKWVLHQLHFICLTKTAVKY